MKLPAKTLITERLGHIFTNLGHEDFNPGASFARMDIDSLDKVDIIMAIEEEFRVEISDEDCERLTNVPETVAYLAERGV